MTTETTGTEQENSTATVASGVATSDPATTAASDSAQDPQGAATDGTQPAESTQPVAPTAPGDQEPAPPNPGSTPIKPENWMNP